MKPTKKQLWDLISDLCFVIATILIFTRMMKDGLPTAYMIFTGVLMLLYRNALRRT